MTAEVWYGRKPRPVPLQQALVNIIDVLAARAEHYVLLSYFRLVARHDEIALIVLKPEGVFLAEIVQAWDPIEGQPQGQWHALKPDGARVPLQPDRLNPYRQIQTHYIDWRDWLIAHQVELSGEGVSSTSIDFTDIFSYIVLYPDLPPGSHIAPGPRPVQVTSLSGFLTALMLRSSIQLQLSPSQIQRIPRWLGLESPFGTAPVHAPRRITKKLDPDYQLPRFAALVALGHDFSIPLIRLPNTETLRVGRDDDNDVIIRHPAVSRHHAQLLRQGECWLVQDLGSDNGTYLSPTGLPADEHCVAALPDVLRDRAVVRFGPVAYMVSV